MSDYEFKEYYHGLFRQIKLYWNLIA